jgi:hypothetical protein
MDILKEVLEEIADGQMQMAKEARVSKQGWFFNPVRDGWVHPDVRENGEQVLFENVDDVLEYIAR